MILWILVYILIGLVLSIKFTGWLKYGIEPCVILWLLFWPLMLFIYITEGL